MEDLKETLAQTGTFFKRLGQGVTRARVIAALCILAVMCGACCIFSLCQFENANFFKAFYGFSTLDNDHSYYSMDYGKYIVHFGGSREADINAFLKDLSGGDFEIKEGDVTPYDNVVINGERTMLNIEYRSLPDKRGYYLIEVL